VEAHTPLHNRHQPVMHTVKMGSKGARRRKPRHPLSVSSTDGVPLRVADMPGEYSTLTPYGAAMGMAAFAVKLIRRVTGADRRG